MGFSYFNPNPAGQKVGDCTVRAIAKATRKSWDEVYIGLCLQGLIMGDLPSANSVWSAYLRQQGFTRNVIPNTCPDCYTVADSAQIIRVGCTCWRYQATLCAWKMGRILTRGFWE